MYGKIINQRACIVKSNVCIDGVYANQSEWEKYGFYPMCGMVGVVVKQAPHTCILKIREGIYVRIRRDGLQEISFEAYQSGLCNNVCEWSDEEDNEDFYDDEFESYERYQGSYAQDMEDWSDQDIDNVFDGDPEVYWNID